MDKHLKVILDLKSSKDTLYIMRRDFRIKENYSIVFGHEFATKKKKQFYIFSNLREFNSKYNEKQINTIKSGLEIVATEAYEMNYHFECTEEISALEFVDLHNIDCIILDFSPFKKDVEYVKILKEICAVKRIRLLVCDSHNIVPCDQFPYHIRSLKKITSLLYENLKNYLIDFPVLERFIWNKKVKKCKIQNPTGIGKMNKERAFLEKEFYFYNEIYYFLNCKKYKFDKPLDEKKYEEFQNIGPWVLLGLISAQGMLLRISKAGILGEKMIKLLIEQVFIWKEISEHFTFHGGCFNEVDTSLQLTIKKVRKSFSEANIYYSNYEIMQSLTADAEWNALMAELRSTNQLNLYRFILWCKKLSSLSEYSYPMFYHIHSVWNEHSLMGNTCYWGFWMIIAVSGSYIYNEPDDIDFYKKIASIKKLKCKQYILYWAKPL